MLDEAPETGRAGHVASAVERAQQRHELLRTAPRTGGLLTGDGEVALSGQHDGHVTLHRALGIHVDGGISSFGEDANGELYVCELGNGVVARIDPS